MPWVLQLAIVHPVVAVCVFLMIWIFLCSFKIVENQKTNTHQKTGQRGLLQRKSYHLHPSSKEPLGTCKSEWGLAHKVLLGLRTGVLQTLTSAQYGMVWTLLWSWDNCLLVSSSEIQHLEISRSTAPFKPHLIIHLQERKYLWSTHWVSMLLKSNRWVLACDQIRLDLYLFWFALFEFISILLSPFTNQAAQSYQNS